MSDHRVQVAGSQPRQTRRSLVLAACCCLVALLPTLEGSANSLAPTPGSNAVLDWVTIIQPAIHNPTAPRPVPLAEILHNTIHLAVYDAVIAIEGGYEPYAAHISVPQGADVRAAVATAAYRTARERVAQSQYAYLDEQYALYLAGIPDGQAKSDGIQVGETAASAILALRANDGFNNVVVYQCSSNPPPAGEFQPNAGCGTQPVGTNVSQITPFTFSDPTEFAPDGPPPLGSDEYTADFVETRDYGRSNSAFRTPEQTDIVYFWSEHSYVHWNRNLNSLAASRHLSVRDTARFLAMVHTAASDAVIAGFEAKYFHRFWRPRTAIPRAAEDGNPGTDPDPSWLPELTVNHPEYPSAHAFWSTAVTDTVAAFFGTDRLNWTIETPQSAVPQVIQTVRTYRTVNELMREIDDARVWAGLHWRSSMRDGGKIGRKVAKHVTRNFFRPTQ
jgi:hypothetical protein